MIKKKSFLKFFMGRCDCCKRVTQLKNKLEVQDEDLIVGELQLCPVCFSHLTEAENNSEKKLKINNNDEEEDFGIESWSKEDFEKNGFRVENIF